MKAIYKNETRIWSTLEILDNNGDKVTSVQVPIEYAAGYDPGDTVDLEAFHNEKLKYSVLGQLNSEEIRATRSKEDGKESYKNNKETKQQNSDSSKNIFAVLAIAFVVFLSMIYVLGGEVTTWVLLLAVPIYILLKSLE